MENKIFNNFKIAAGVASVGFASLCIFGSFYLLSTTFSWFEEDGMYANQINLQGKGEVFAVPDIITFNYTIKETADTVSEAQTISNAKNNKILSILKEAGIEDKDIKTTSYNIYPKYEWQSGPCRDGFCESGKNVLIGQDVSQTISVKVRETEIAGDLLGKIGAVDVSNVSSLTFSVDDVDVLKAEARKIAIEDAKEKAKELEKELGIKLGDIVGFYESDDQFYPEPMMRTEAYGAALDSVKSVVSLPSGENKIVSNINLSFEIKN